MDLLDALDDDSDGDVDNPIEIETRTRSNMVVAVDPPPQEVGTLLDVLEDEPVDTTTEAKPDPG